MLQHQNERLENELQNLLNGRRTKKMHLCNCKEIKLMIRTLKIYCTRNNKLCQAMTLSEDDITG